MATQHRDLVFISYSHKDRKWLSDLLTFLKPYRRRGLEVWADAYIETGGIWRREIDAALQRACVGVLLVSQDFLASDFIYESELPALTSAADRGELTLVCVPLSSFTLDVSGLDAFQWPRDPQAPLAATSGNRRKRALVEIVDAIVDAAEKCHSVVQTAPSAAPRAVGHPATGRSDTLAVLHGVPPQRPNLVTRSDELSEIRRLLLAGTLPAIGITARANGAPQRLGLQGRGGIGKTVLAIDVVNDDEIRRAFSDGIFWVTLGQTPAIEELQADLLHAITGRRPSIDSRDDGRALLRDALAQRAAMIVLDDVWQATDAAPFDGVDRTGRLLITTRDSAVVTALGAAELPLDVLQPEAAVRLLAYWAGVAPHALPDEATAIVEECGRLPLALTLAGGRIRDGSAWSALLAALRARRADYLDHPLGGVFSSMQLSLDALPALQRERLQELAVFPEDVAIPLQTIARYWAYTGWLTAAQSLDLLQVLHGKGLLYLDETAQHATVAFHDLQRDFLLLSVDRPATLHHRLLNAHEHAYQVAGEAWQWWQLPADEPYLWDHLITHLGEAERHDEARHLLFDYRWLDAKLRVRDINRVLRDYDGLPATDSARLVEGALRLSAHVLDRRPAQLAAQLTGRLLAVESADVRTLLDSIRQSPPACWLAPQRANLTPPGGSLLRTLVGHGAAVNGVALAAHGRHVVSAADDGRLKIWSLESGVVVSDIDAHGDAITALAVSNDGRLAVTASADFTVKVWDLDSARLRFDLARTAGLPIAHYGSVAAIVLSRDGRVAATGAHDGTLKVWDLEKGRVLRAFHGHPGRVTALAMTRDARTLVSASVHRLLMVWGIGDGGFVRTLGGHRGAIRDIVLTPDDRQLLSASDDGTVKVWDLATGALHHDLAGHSRRVNAVAVTAEGDTALSVSHDHTLKVWDLASGRLRHDLRGHGDWVGAVTPTHDGKRALSASQDRTLKLWDIRDGRLLLDFSGHEHWVRAVVVSDDDRRAVSASADHTLKVWDLDLSRRVHRLAGHDDAVNALALTADGRYVVSASSDHTIKVWDLHHGVLVHPLRGHGGWVNALALTGDGRRLVSAAGDHTVKVWDLESGTLLHDLDGHDGWVYDVAVTTDGRYAVSASFDCTLRVWDIMQGVPACELGGHLHSVYAVALSHDGRHAVSASGDHTLAVWDLEHGRRVGELRGHKDAVVAVALHPDGQRAISASRDGTLGVWHVPSQTLLHHLVGHQGGVNAIAMAADRHHVYSASDDGTIRRWNIDDGTAAGEFSGHVDKVHAVCELRDGAGVVSVGDDRMLKVWDASRETCWVEFCADAKLSCVTLAANGRTVVAGDALGRLHFLRFEGCAASADLEA